MTIPERVGRAERLLGIRRQWVVWAYAIRPGWESTGEYETRWEAREVRDELVEFDGYPKGWVRIRREDAGSPKRRPAMAEILGAQAHLVGAKD